jgi:hypothetical protein
MGCAGISGNYSKNLQAKSRKPAVIAVESPTATFQLDDFLWPMLCRRFW